jgi:hypothetical protein
MCNPVNKTRGIWDILINTHCNKTDREIPVHTHDDAGRQRFCTGKYFPYESGINTCLAPEVFHPSGIFPRYTA